METTTLRTGYAPVNGLNLYYEVHGTGEPLVLLHGGLGSTDLLGDLLRKDYDWSEEVAAIEAPTLLVFGDADSIRLAHVVEFFGLLGGGKKDAGWDGSGMSDARLAILPGVTHYNIFSSPALAPIVTPFLDAAMP